MLGLLLFGYLMTYVFAEPGADVVLSCMLVEDGAVMDGVGRALFTQTPSTLVLRDVPVTSGQLLDTLTPFNPSTFPDPDVILFEAKVSSPEIPDADLLLHANRKEVACDISRYFPLVARSSTEPTYFIGSLQLEGGALSMAVVLKILDVESDTSEEPLLVQNHLGLPLSQSGSLLTEVVFLVFSSARSVSTPLGGDVLLSCGFRQPEMPPMQEVGLEWRLQYKGSGRRVIEMRAGLPDTEERPQVHVDREGVSVDPALLVEQGNASLTMTELKVSDEGTYICTITVGLFQAQQVIKLQVTQPPRVSLSEEKMVFQDESPQKLSCHCQNYYPLDVQMEWFSLSPTSKVSTLLPEQGSLSSHRQHGDGTFSLTSYLMLTPSSFPPGTTVTCMVSHPGLATPLSVSLMVEEPEPDSYWMILGFLFVTVVFFYQVMR